MKNTYSREEAKQIFYAARTGFGIYKDFEDFEMCQESKRAEKEKQKDAIYPQGILSFNHNHGIQMFNESMWSNFGGYNQWVRESLAAGSKIQIVKNSLGEVLTVGDMTNFGKIESFGIYPNSIRVDLSVKGQECAKHFDAVHPAKAFVTEDGYKIEDGCLVTLVYPDFNTGLDHLDTVRFPDYKNTKVFAKKDNATKYIDLNKKVYSKQDILNAETKEMINPMRFEKSFIGGDWYRGDANNLVINKSKLGL